MLLCIVADEAMVVFRVILYFIPHPVFSGGIKWGNTGQKWLREVKTIFYMCTQASVKIFGQCDEEVFWNLETDLH